MLTETLSAQTKVWIYQSDRAFTEEDKKVIIEKLVNFVTNWESHGKDVSGAFDIKYDQFIVLYADLSLSDVSGCSIDKSVVTIKSIEAELQLNLLDKSKVAYLDNTDTVQVVDFREIKSAVEQGKMTPNTIVFDNTITTFEDLEAKWKSLAGETWLKRYFA